MQNGPWHAILSIYVCYAIRHNQGYKAVTYGKCTNLSIYAPGQRIERINFYVFHRDEKFVCGHADGGLVEPGILPRDVFVCAPEAGVEGKTR